jgi:hypothetical protein
MAPSSGVLGLRVRYPRRLVYRQRPVLVESPVIYNIYFTVS